MTPLKRLLAIFTALTLLFALPVMGTDAGASPAKSPKTKAQKRAAAKKHRKHKRRKHAKKHKAAGKKGPKAKRPQVDADDTVLPVGTVSAIDGDVLTVALNAGGTLTARVTDDSVVFCKGDDDDADDADDADDETGDDPGSADDDDYSDDDDDGDDSDFDARSTRLADGSCAPAVGDVVYEADVEDGVFDTLDLAGD